MHDILQLHCTIQRRSFAERYVVLFVTSALTVFFMATCFIHETVLSQHSESIVQKLVRKKRRKVASVQEQKHHHHAHDPSFSVREQFEKQHAEILTAEKMYEALQEQRRDHPLTSPSDLPYDIFDCPVTPPADYPYAWNSLRLLTHWNPDETKIPNDYIYQGLCMFDWRNETQREVAQWYREAELPLVLQNHPDVTATAYRWSTPDYLHKLLGNETQRNEHSKSNNMMFWRMDTLRVHTNWQSPTDNVQLTYAEWKQRADQVNALTDTATAEHWYFRLHAADTSHYLYDELPYFRPAEHPTTFIVDSDEQRGINCRLGMKGNIAAAHFDPTRNWIVLLHGQRRYILAHPDQCKHFELYPRGHPSGRHSSVDWSAVDQSYAGPFAAARLNEVVLQAGDALYLPTNWFHYIVSLTINAQCNARSGTTKETRRYIQECGF